MLENQIALVRMFESAWVQQILSHVQQG